MTTRKTERSNATEWRAVIVDDEPRSRAIARRMLAAYPHFKVVAECSNGYDAVLAVREFTPQLVLLDIQMPEMDGFEVIKNLDPRHLPMVVFITAYDQYAVRAFEVHALDYLLKPFDEDRFGAMIGRAQEKLVGGDNEGYTQRVLAMLQTLHSARTFAEKLMVRLRGKIILIPVAEVDWIKAEDNYIRIHAGSNSYLDRETLSALADRLDPKKFARVHRSAVINVDRMKEMTVVDGEYDVVLLSGAKIPLSRTYRDDFLLMLKNVTATLKNK